MELEFEAGSNNEKYKVEVIHNNTVSAKKLKSDYLSGFYYLIV